MLLIHEPISDPADSPRAKKILCQIVTVASNIDARWLNFLPSVDVFPTTRRFLDLEPVKEYYSDHEDDGDWDGVITFVMARADGTYRLYVGGDQGGRRRPLCPELFGALASLMWNNSLALRQASYEQAEALRYYGTEEEHFALFKTAFIKYQLDSALLWEESEKMYHYFRRLDFLLRIGHIAPDPAPATRLVQ